MGCCRFVRAELENGMAVKGGSAVLSQISRRLFRPLGVDTLVHCPKIVHGCHYPIAPKLDFLQIQDHAAFPKRNHCSGHTILGPTSPAVISPHDVIFTIPGRRHFACHSVGLTFADLNLQT